MIPPIADITIDTLINTSTISFVFIYMIYEFCRHYKCQAYLLKKQKDFPHLEDMDNQNHRIAVLGKSGSGKSHFTGHLVDRMNPDKRFIVLSAVDEDAAYDPLGPIRLDIYDPDTYELPIEEFNNSIVVFDDVENLADKAVNKAILRLRNMLLEKGRHHKIDVVSISHDALAGKDTKLVHAESTAAVMFPKYAQAHTMGTYLKKYIGLSADNVQKIKELGNHSRWIFVSNTAPTYVLHAHGAEILN